MELRLSFGGLRIVKKNLRVFISFSRPHTVIGTTASVIGLYLIALSITPAGEYHLDGLVLALLSCLAANIYIVGLNQITDLEIDRINKPDLPLASGAFSIRTAWSICLASLAAAILIAASQGIYLLITVIVSLIIGTTYSAPPLRLKRFHFWAAACIFTVRGVVVNLFLFLHFNSLLNTSNEIPLKIWILTAFIFGLSLVIAWFKDIPDVAGDRRFAIMTLSIKLGPIAVYRIGLILLTVFYGAMIFTGIAGVNGINGSALVVSHLALLTIMWLVGRKTDPGEKSSITRFYLFIWGLFYSEYIFFAGCCLLA